MAASENLTIMFTDIVGFTERIARVSRREHLEIIAAHDRILQPLVERYGGQRIQFTGDGMLLVFRSATDGVRCGLAMQTALDEHNAKSPPAQHLRIRVALSAGDVQIVNRHVYGEPVNLASRLEGVTPSGEVYFTEAVYFAMKRAEVQCEEVGSQFFKGLSTPVRIFRAVPVRQPLAAAGAASGRDRRRRRRGVAALAAGSVAVAATLAVVVLWLLERPGLVGKAGEETLSGERIERAFAAGDDIEVTRLAAARLAADPADAKALLYQGHVAINEGRLGDGFGLYRKALGGDPTLRSDPVLVANLLDQLVPWGNTVRAIILDHPSPEIVDALAEASDDPGPRRRLLAAMLLEALGEDARVDRVGAALRELKEADSCGARRAAVRTLHRLGDPEALPALRAVNDGDFGDKLRNACLWLELRRAIADLEKGAAS